MPEHDPKRGKITWHDMQTFYRKGSKTPPLGEHQLMPVMIAQYHQINPLHIRYDYPLVLLDEPVAPGETGQAGGVVHSLMRVIDDLVTQVVGTGDEAEILRRQLYRVEADIKSQVAEAGSGRLSELWNAAVEHVCAQIPDSRKREIATTGLQHATDALQLDGKVISCDEHTLSQLLWHVWQFYWREKGRPVREEIEALIRQLTDILRVDEEKMEEANPERLRDSMGTNDVDFNTLSQILRQGHIQTTLPATRRERIQTTIEKLNQMKRIYGNVPPAELLVHDFASAKTIYATQMKSMVEFFKWYRIGVLESQNKYKEETFDPLFADFDLTDLTPEELNICPPVLVDVSSDDLTGEDQAALLDILDSNQRIKMLLRVSDVAHHWAQMATALGSAFVWQTTNSNIERLFHGGTDGLAYAGPALFCIYVGNSAHIPLLSPYLRAAVAVESRAFPAFLYHPGHGTTWASRFDVTSTPQPERHWSLAEVTYTDGEEEHTREMNFTYAHFAAMDTRFANHFLPVPQTDWVENMVPLSTFMAMDGAEARDKVPYLLLVDAEGSLFRAVVSREMVAKTRLCLTRWNLLQELGGINNSYVNAAIEAEKERLAAEKAQELQALEAKYQAEMDQNVGELTKVIIDKIASGLLSESSGMATFAPVTTPATAPPKPPTKTEETPPASEPAAEEEPEEEAITFDEPYIDTPLCTSCNECINKNNKMFAYDENKQAIIKDATAGTFRQLVEAAENCPVHIIHPGKPKNPNEEGLEDLMKRAEKFN